MDAGGHYRVVFNAHGKGKMKKAVGIAALLVAFGMLLMLFISNKIIGIIIIGLLIFVGCSCYGKF